MKKSLQSLCFIWILAIAFIECQSVPCTTPLNRPGICVRVEKCSNIFKILERAKVQSIHGDLLNYANKARCSLAGVTAHAVCCQPGQVVQLLLPSECGVSSQDRIANGDETQVFEFPWMAVLRYKFRSVFRDNCGGTLISNRYVLTAAHCIKTKSTLELDHVRLGEHTKQNHTDCNYFIDGEPECADPVRDYKIESSVIHPQYELNRYDIGMLRLSKEVMFTDHITPICLPTTSDLRNFIPKRYIVTGWGTTETGSTSDVLLQASLPHVDVTSCESVLNRLSARSQFRLDKHIHICAGGEGLTDSCRGDSGGPLSAPTPTAKGVIRFVQFGVVSRGIGGCGTISAPGVYTKVAAVMQWISDNMVP